MVGKGSKRTTRARKPRLAKLAAAVIALLLLGMTASGALADGSDPGTTTDATTAAQSGTGNSLTNLMPSIATDQSDYAPGSTVTVSGDGWSSGEAVHVRVNDTKGQTWSYAVDMAADLSGKFTVQFQLPNYFVSDYDVTATGSAGETAVASFTDSNVKVATAPAGVTATIAATVYTSTDCSGTGTSQSIHVDSAGTTLGGIGTSDSVLLQASATADQTGSSFVGWSAGTPVASPARSVCFRGVSGTATVTATYTAPSTNHAPVVAANNASVSANEGSAVTNTGTFGDPDSGDTVSLDASVGTVTQSGPGTWSWSLPTTDQKSLTNVMVTATDSHGATATATFSYSVASVAPSVTAPASQTATVNASPSLDLGSFDDPGSDSPWSVDVDWGDGTTHGSGSVTGSGPAAGTSIPAQSHTYSVGGSYVVTVKVTDKDGAFGTNSFQVNVAKLSQTIDFAAPAGRTYGDADFDPGATATSGLQVSYSSSTTSVCTIVSGQVHIVAAGLCSVTASQPGDSTYDAATDVTQELTVAQKAVTITPSAGQGKVFGASDPALTFTNDGGLSAGGFTGALARATGEDVGSYAIDLGTLDAGTNYILALSGVVDFSITPKPVTITPDSDQSKVYGAADPALTFTNDGGLVIGDFTGTLSRDEGETVGQYTITLGTLSAGLNYSLSLAGTPVSFTITRAPGSVTIGNIPADAVYGGSFTVSYEALGDGTPGVVSETPGTCSASGDTVSFVAAGDCDLHATVTQGTNYFAATGLKQSFTIARKAVTVTPDAGQHKVYGGADPTLTYTSTGLLGDDSLSGALGRVTGESVGDYAITIGTLDAGANYDVSLSGTVDFAITPHDLRVAATPQTKVYGSADPGLSYSVTPDDLQFDDTEGGVLSGSLGRASGEDVGKYAITVGSLAANGNYSLVFTPSELEVTPHDLRVAADPQTKVYGSADPGLTYSVTKADLQLDDTEAGVLSGTLGRAPGEDVGSYAITVGSLAANGNYSLVFTPSELEVTPHDLRVAAGPQTKVYGSADPELTYSVTKADLQFDDTEGDVLSGSLHRDSGEDVGTYAITVGSLAASGNYSLVFTPSELEVTPHDLRVAADPQTKVYGSADPGLTYSVTKADLQFDDTEAGVLSGSLERASGETVAGGPYAITVGTLAANGNYTLVFTPSELAITPRDLAVTATGIAKVYDGTRTATVTLGDDSLTGDDVADHYTGALFADKNVGSGKTVTVSGISIDGADAGNYNLTNTTATTTADITARDLVVTATGVDKVYDGTTAATVRLSTDEVSGDAVDPAYTNAYFDNVNVGTAKDVHVSGISISGDDAGNYNLTNTTATTTADITARPVTVTPDSGQSKLLGAADPTLTYKVTSPLGPVAGDVFSGALARVAGEGVGSYAITQGTLALSSNYTLTFTSGVLFNIYYRWDGFLQPINDTAHQIGLLMSQFKLGSTVPAKFQLKKADGTVVQSANPIAFAVSANLGACGTTSTETVDADTATSGGTYRFDTTAQQYIYNWSTKGLKAGIYRIWAVLDDPSGKTSSYVNICLR